MTNRVLCKVKNKSTRSKRRHPKIAISRKNQDKIRAFSLHSDFDDDESNLSKDFNDFEELNRQKDKETHFRSNSMMEGNRLDTPGFISVVWKETNTNDRTGTTETYNTTSKTVSSNARPNSRLRFKRINIVKRFKKLDNADWIKNLSDKKFSINRQRL